MTGITNISTLITIIFGLMLTDLFASVHRLIRHRRRVRWHWLPLLTAWYVLAMVLKNWWGLVFDEGSGSWGSGWIFFYYGHLLLLLYLVASAVLPDEVPEAGLDLEDHYYRTRRHFWGLLTAVYVMLLAYAALRPVFTEQPLVPMALVSNAVMAAVSLSLARVRRTGYHSVVVVLLVALTLSEIILRF